MKKLSYPLIGALIGAIFSFFSFRMPFPLTLLVSSFLPSGYQGPFPPGAFLWLLLLIGEPILTGFLIGSIIKIIKEKKITKYGIIVIIISIIIATFWVISIGRYVAASKDIQPANNIDSSDSIKLPNIKY